MEFQELVKRSKEVQRRFDRLRVNKRWGAAEIAQGFVGDVGDLLQLILARNGYRRLKDLDKRTAHELADCLWAIILLADRLGIDLEKAFMKNMDELMKRKRPDIH